MSLAALTNISKRSSHIHYVASFLGLLSLILIASYSGHLSDKQPGYGAIILIAWSMQNGNSLKLKTFCRKKSDSDVDMATTYLESLRRSTATAWACNV